MLWSGSTGTLPAGRWLARKDSNLRSPDPESGALPLGHSPVDAAGMIPQAIANRPQVWLPRCHGPRLGVPRSRLTTNSPPWDPVRFGTFRRGLAGGRTPYRRPRWTSGSPVDRADTPPGSRPARHHRGRRHGDSVRSSLRLTRARCRPAGWRSKLTKYHERSDWARSGSTRPTLQNPALGLVAAQARVARGRIDPQGRVRRPDGTCPGRRPAPDWPSNRPTGATPPGLDVPPARLAREAPAPLSRRVPDPATPSTSWHDDRLQVGRRQRSMAVTD